VWQIDWAHPKFGVILASCSYDAKVIIWKDHGAGSWKKIKEHTLHSASGTNNELITYPEFFLIYSSFNFTRL
jgi:hypothetical protein